MEDISKIEDLIVNPLNNILMICQDQENYKKVEIEILRLISTLENNKIIKKRKTRIVFDDKEK